MKRKATILVVDDSEGVTKTLSMLLQESGYTAIPAYTAEHALDVISGVAVDVVLLDINLPGRDGVAAAIDSQEDSKLQNHAHLRRHNIDRNLGTSKKRGNRVSRPGKTHPCRVAFNVAVFA